MKRIEALDVAEVLAGVDGEYHDGLDIFLSASAVALVETGYVVLTVGVTKPADTPDEEDVRRVFRFVGFEVTPSH